MQNSNDKSVVVAVSGLSEGGHGLLAAGAPGEVPLPASKLGPEIPDLDGLRVNSGFSNTEQVEKKQTLVNVKRPGSETFVRVRAVPDLSHCYILHKDEEIGSYYMVDPRLDYGLPNFGKLHRIHSAVTRNGEAFLWPVPEGEPGSRENSWNESHRLAAQEAKSVWVRVVADQAKRAFVLVVARANLVEPVWPTESLDSQISRAFAGRVINTVAHPIVRKLLGLE